MDFVIFIVFGSTKNTRELELMYKDENFLTVPQWHPGGVQQHLELPAEKCEELLLFMLLQHICCVSAFYLLAFMVRLILRLTTISSLAVHS